MIEATWALNRGVFDLDAVVVRALEGALNGKLEHLVKATEAFGMLSGLAPYAAAIKDFVSHPVVQRLRYQNPSTLNCSNLFIFSGPALQLFCRGLCDTTFADRWFASFVEDGISTTTPLSDLGRTYSLLSSELDCLQSWSTFAQMLSQLLAKWRRESPDDRLFTVSSSSFSFAMSLANLRALRKNIGLAEAGRLDLASSFLKNECLSMTKSSSGLLLSFSRIESIEECTPPEWIEAVRLVSEIAKMVSMSLMTESVVRSHSRCAFISFHCKLTSIPEFPCKGGNDCDATSRRFCCHSFHREPEQSVRIAFRFQRKEPSRNVLCRSGSCDVQNSQVYLSIKSAA